MTKSKQEKLMLSEMTSGMEEAALKEMQTKVEKMTEEELEQFLAEVDPDSMGFAGEECPI